MSEVEEIVEKLRSKHEEKYTPEQFRAWAHMHKCDSYDAPPDKPFFRKKKLQDSAPDATSVSPGRRIDLRSQCIEQLDKWHALLDKGAITHEQYKDLQSTILEDIKRF